MEMLDEHSLKVYLHFSEYDCSICGMMNLQVKYQFSLHDRENVPFVETQFCSLPAIHSDPYLVLVLHCTVPVYKPSRIQNKVVLS
jgi:hypothetical protein